MSLRTCYTAYKIKRSLLFFLWLALFTVLSCENYDPRIVVESSSYHWDIPPHIPLPREFADNPMSQRKVELGRYLFYDKRLSGNQTFACATCHHQRRAFADDPDIDDGSSNNTYLGNPQAILVPLGATGEAHPRNSMALVNLAWQPVLTWGNPLMRRLRTQALVPIFGENPIELGLFYPDERLQELSADPVYQELFPAAFPYDRNPFRMTNVVNALEAFQRAMISFNSPYDRQQRGDVTAISESAKRGEELFFNEDLECFHCHGGINFTLMEDHRNLSVPSIDFTNNGLYNIGGTGAYPPGNTGIHEVTNNPNDMGRFKAPTLRNIELTAPYMHDGSAIDLDSVIDHYAAGGRTITSGPYAGNGSASPFKNSFVKGFTLTAQERADLIAFLKSLTDCDYVTSEKFRNPWPVGHFNRPSTIGELPEGSHPCAP